ncbi:hypothetical protein [Paracoccus sp. SSK6]|uniref:hypothetical protein n=1 Tax=Paracoccus sp. SSK6 TaxID=3143131 RepID=UPI00321A84F1
MKKPAGQGGQVMPSKFVTRPLCRPNRRQTLLSGTHLSERSLCAVIEQLFDLLLTSASPEQFPGSEGELQLALLINARRLEHQDDMKASQILRELAGRIEVPTKRLIQ